MGLNNSLLCIVERSVVCLASYLLSASSAPSQVVPVNNVSALLSAPGRQNGPLLRSTAQEVRMAGTFTLVSESPAQYGLAPE